MDILSPSDEILFKGTNEKGESLYDDASVREKTLMGENTLTLKFKTTSYIDFPEGSYVFFSRDNSNVGEYYYLLDTAKCKMNNTRYYEYDITFESLQSLLKTRIFRFFTKRLDEQVVPALDAPFKTKGWYSGRPIDFIQCIVMTMNDGDAGWEIGSVIEGDVKTIEFNNMDCYSFLQQVANTYNTEFEVLGKTISLGRVEKDKENPVDLSYGKGNGFKAGVNKDKGKTKRINRLLIQGGNRNISYTQYGNDTLLFPKDRTVEYEGVEYKTDIYGKYLQRADFSPTDRIIEGVLDLSEIYPMREGEVTATVTDVTDGIYTITDSSLVSEAIDYSAFFIEGTTPTLVLHSGDLTGREFNIEAYDKTTGTFTISAFTDGGVMLPNDSLKPRVGDRYAVFNIIMPSSYVSDAEERALEQALPYFHEESKTKISINGEIQGLYLKENWVDIGSKMDVGYFIRLASPMIPNPENLRITKITDKVNRPMMPEVDLSNEIKVNSWSNLKNDIVNQEVVTERQVNQSVGYGNRNWWDVKQTQDMMIDPDGQFQQALLSALLIETGHLVVGFNSSQMDFKGVIFQPNYNNNPNDFRNTAGTLDHFTINGDETVRTWNISAKNNTLNSSYAYYVYAKCPIVGDDGEILVTTEKITVKQVANYYHFFVGILNTPRTDTGVTTRSWKPVFGFTEISGSDIVTGVIRDRLSRIIIDLVNGTIYGKMTFASGSSGYNNLSDKPDLSPMYDALTLANSKKRVFRSTPYPPYEAGDLWLRTWVDNGATRNDIFVCTTSRSSGSFQLSEWDNAVNHDNTKTVIDGGLVTAGTIQLAGNVGAILAGITGQGTTSGSVRIWAGASFTNRETAPFRVTQGGTVTMTDANVTGTITANSGYIGNFKIESSYIGTGESLNGMGLYDRLIKFRNTSYGTVAMIGENVNPGTAGEYRAVARFENTYSNSGYYGDNAGVVITVNGSRYRNQHIVMYSSNGREMILETRNFPNDDSWYFRTCLRMSHMPSTSQINGIASGSTRYNVKWDSQSGYLFIE